jgi:hypothetical protein
MSVGVLKRNRVGNQTGVRDPFGETMMKTAEISQNGLLMANIFAMCAIVLVPLPSFLLGYVYGDTAPGGWRALFLIGTLVSVWSHPFVAGVGGFQVIRAYTNGDRDRMLRWTFCTFGSLAIYMFCFAVLMISQIIRPVTAA